MFLILPNLLIKLYPGHFSFFYFIYAAGDGCYLHVLNNSLKKIHENQAKNLGYCGKTRQTDRHLYLVIKLRVVPSGAKSNLLSTGALSTKIHYLHEKYYIKGTTTSI